MRDSGEEAKVLARLNHPNIAAIYGLEQWQGTHYLVLELVEGETLAEKERRVSTEKVLQRGRKVKRGRPRRIRLL